MDDKKINNLNNMDIDNHENNDDKKVISSSQFSDDKQFNTDIKADEKQADTVSGNLSDNENTDDKKDGSISKNIQEEADEKLNDENTADNVTKPVKVKKTKGQKYKKLKRMMKTTKTMAECDSKVDMYKYLARQFDKLQDYKSSQELAEKCREMAKKTKKLIKQQVYETAVKLKNSAVRPHDYKLAAMEFRKISGYLDSDNLAAECDLSAVKLEKKLTCKKILLSAFAVIILVSLFIFANTPFGKYKAANLLLYTGSYNSAIKIYNKIGDYNDSADKMSEAYYKKGIKLMEDARYEDALKALKTAGDYKDSQRVKADVEKLIIKNSSIKDTVKLGKYDWQILDIVDNKALLLKKTSESGILYNDSLNEVSWEDSTLRQWLNSCFYTDSFSAEERKNIVKSTIANPDNPSTGIDGGNDTEDYIFILSMEEALKYLDIMPVSDYNIWLRTPGSSKSRAVFITSDKSIMENGYEVNSGKMAIRPALWLSLE